MKYPAPHSFSLPSAWQSVNLDAGPCCGEKKKNILRQVYKEILPILPYGYSFSIESWHAFVMLRPEL